MVASSIARFYLTDTDSGDCRSLASSVISITNISASKATSSVSSVRSGNALNVSLVFLYGDCYYLKRMILAKLIVSYFHRSFQRQIKHVDIDRDDGTEAVMARLSNREPHKQKQTRQL